MSVLGSITKPDWSRRSNRAERLDTETLEFDDYRACMRDLAIVNRVTLAARPTMAFLDKVLARGAWAPGSTLRIVDVGFGYGDMLRRIERWIRRRGLKAELIGVDINPAAALVAQRDGDPIKWVTSDLFRYDPPGGIDLVVSSLFAHHLDDPGVVRFLGWMDRTARIGWLVNDLHRHWLPHAVYGYGTRVTGCHRIVREDGQVSITRAFTHADWRRLIAAAKLDEMDLSLRWHFPFRLCLGRIRTA